jgi:hypothetical protein
MGHIINPISLRLSVNRLWDYQWFNSNNYEYYYLQLQQNNLQGFLIKFFNLKLFPMNGYLYSHSSILYFSKYVDVKVYIYKTLQNVKIKFYKFQDFLVIISKFFYDTLYQKSILILSVFFDCYFKSLKNILKNKVKLWFTDSGMDFCLFFLYAVVKKQRFYNFFCIANLIVLFKFFVEDEDEENIPYNIERRNKVKKLMPNMATLKLFFFFVRFKFWRKVSFFLRFYFSKFLKNKIYLRICKINSLGVNAKVIGNYITRRLRQRFKVVELILPVIRYLKKDLKIIGFKFSFCGRFSREEMATTEYFSHAAVPFNTINLFIDHSVVGVILKDSFCGIKVWLNMKKDMFKDFFFFSQNTIWGFLF